MMLDAGVTLEPERLGLVEKLKSREPAQWNPDDVAAYQAGMNPDVGGVPLKLAFGSDFPYREADAHLGLQYDKVGLRPSFAKGGLSNVWGATMMPLPGPGHGGMAIQAFGACAALLSRPAVHRAIGSPR